MLNKIINENVARLGLKSWDNCEEYLLRITQGIKRDVMREVKQHGGKLTFRVTVRNTLGYSKTEDVTHGIQVVVTCLATSRELKETVKLKVGATNPLVALQGTLKYTAMRANMIRNYTAISSGVDHLRVELTDQLNDMFKTHRSVVSIYANPTGQAEVTAEFLQTSGPSMAALFDKIAQHTSLPGLSASPTV
jgi:hypothetical protein